MSAMPHRSSAIAAESLRIRNRSCLPMPYSTLCGFWRVAPAKAFAEGAANACSRFLPWAQWSIATSRFGIACKVARALSDEFRIFGVSGKLTNE